MSLVLLFFLALSQIARAGSFSEPESRQADISFFQNDENSYFEKAVSRLKWAALQMLANKQAAAESVMAISLIAPPDITVECNQIPAPQMPAATTTCNSDINLTLREVKTNIQCENAYVLQRIWIATDTCAGVARDTQFVTVKDTQKPTLHLTHPRLLGYEDGDTVHLYCDQGLTFDADDAYATDNCDGSASVIFVDYIIENSDCARNGYLMKMVCGWIAEDNCNNRDSITLTFLVFDNIAPVFGAIPDTQVIDCHRLAHIIQPEVTDNCEGLISITSDDVIMPGRCTGEKMIMRTWRAFDQCGNNSSKEQIILVRDTTAPVFVGVPRDTFIACDAAVPAPATVSAVDNCSPNVSVQFSETYSNDGCREVFTRTWSSTDDCGNTGVAVQVISLIDTVGPIITSTPDLEITIECDEDLPTDFPLFEDNCSMALQYDSFSTIIPQDCGYLLEKTWTATDSCGNTTAFTQKVFVVDTTDPVLSNIPADTTVRCDEMPPIAQVTALDNCDPNVQIVFEEDTLGTVCADLRIVRTWTAIDSCGNSTQASQMIQITDDEAPSLFNVPGDVTLECDSAPLPDSVFASDNCDQNVVITVEETTSGDSCTGILTKIWTATDVCGNSSSASQVITFIDTTEPVIQLNHPDLAGVQNGDTLYFECEDLIRLTENDVSITDNCDEDVEVSFDENVTAAADCQQEGYFEKWTFTWQANDNCGNTSEFFLTIFTFDSAAPVLINVPDDFEADCDANIPPAPTVDATDNCSGAVTIELSESMEFNGCDRKIIRTWTATDNCGNASSQSQVITLIDEVAPKVVAAPRDTIIECDASEPLEEPVFEDNCSDSLTITAISSIAQQPCGYIIVKEWTATDDCGNSTTYTRTITAIDSQPPVFSGAPADTTIFCNQIPNPPVVTATDNCDDDIQVNYQEVIHNQSGCSNWRIVRTWSATDDCGNRATTWQTIMIQDNEPPVFSADPADVTVECGQIPPPDTLTATDNCGNVSSLTFEENRIDGNCPDNYTLVRVWEATDECGNLASVSQVVTVADNTPPTLVFNHPRLNGVNDGDTIIFECGNLVLFGEDDVITTDNCSVPDVDFTEDISGSGDCMNDGFFEKLVCRWTATDACGNSTSLSIVVIVTDLTSPEFINFPGDLTINCNDELPEVDSVQIRDNCPLGVSLEFMETQTTGSCPGEIIYERIWTATDHCGNSAVRTQIITQTDTIPPAFVNVPQDLTVSCDSVLGNPEVISAVDNCTDSVSITFEEEILDGNCPGNATVLRTWTATDDCGNSASVSQTITIFDNEAPVFGSTPTDITIECDIPVPDPITPVVSDNCDANVTTTLTETRVDGNCAAEYEIRREWIATDHCGNTSTITQTVFVRDTDGPLVSDPLEDLFISCDALVPAPVTPDFDDNCSDSITIIFSENILPGNCSESSTIVRTWTAVDECGNQNSTVQNIFIRDNTPPAVISQPGDLVVDCSEAIADESPVFEDNCDDDLDISFIADTIPGVCAANFTITRTWRATDNCGNITTISQTISVQDNAAPTLTFNHPQLTGLQNGDTLVISCDATTIFSADDVLTDDDCSDVQVDLNAATFDAQNCAAEGFLQTIHYTWTAIDACGNSGTLNILVVVIDTVAPVLAGVPGNLILSCDASLPPIPTVTATDNCNAANPTVDFEEVISGGACPQEQTIVRTWTATDLCGNTATASQIIQLSDTLAPVLQFTHPDFPNLTDGDTIFINCQQTGAVDSSMLQAVDNCDNAPEIIFEESNIIVGDCNSDGFLLSKDLEWNVSDACGNSASVRITVVLRDENPPLLTGVPDDLSLDCSDAVPPAAIVTATDDCTDTVQPVFEENTLPGNCPGDFQIIRTWAAIDDCGNATAQTQIITVTDNSAPQISIDEPLVQADCDDVPAAPVPLVSDNCDTNVQVTFDEARQNGNCANNYTLIRTWTATDHCGNSATTQQTVEVRDNTAPTMTGVPSDLTLGCDQDIPNPPVVSATDDCSTATRVVYNQSLESGSCNEEVRIIRTWTATDVCGNSRIASQVITLIDTIAPQIIGLPNDLVASCDAIPAVPDSTRLYPIDNCDPIPTISFSETMTGTDCNDRRLIRTWVTEDHCGNSRTYTRTILIRDNVPPVFTNLPPQVTIECDDLPFTPVYEATDNCDDDVDIIFTEVRTDGNCEDNYTLTRIYVASDDCGNQTTFTQLITVIDTTAPLISLDIPGIGAIADGDTIRVECDDLTPLDENSIVATDNCDANPDVEFLEDIEVSDSCQLDGYLTKMDCKWIVTDNCGNMNMLQIFVIISDTTAPVLSGIPADVIVSLAAGESVPTPASATASDNCTDTVAVTFSEILITDSCGFTITRTWTAEDDCGNSGSAAQTIRVSATADIEKISAQATDCGFDNGAASVEIVGDEANLVYTWQPDLGTPNTAGNARTDLPAGDYTVTFHVVDFPLCTQQVNIRVKDGCDVSERDTILVNLLDQATLICLDSFILENQNPIVGIQLCDAGDAATVLASDPDQNCLLLTPAPGFTGQSPDTICIIHCFSLGNCDTTLIVVNIDPNNIQPCVGNPGIFDENHLVLGISNCEADKEVCLDIEPDVVPDFDFEVDGAAYQGSFEVCEFERFVSYSYFLLPGNGVQGPYYLEGWQAGNKFFKGGFENIAALVDSMNLWNPAGNWQLNAVTKMIKSGGTTDSYGAMRIVQTQTAVATSLEPNLGSRAASVSLGLGAGNHELIVTDIITGCPDTAQIDIYCLKTQELWDTLRVDETHIKCVDISELPGVLTGFSTDLQNSRVTCVELMSVENTGCVSYLARQPGQDRLCLMACDEFGMCDTTFLNIVILEKENTSRELIVHNGFSPNGDGQNDIFTIKNIEFYPDNQLTIFNRWGNEILKVKGYKNDWKGAWKGKDLPDGTYYYLLDDGFGNILSGFIQIER